MRRIILGLMLMLPYVAYSQIGDYRTDLAVGVNGGYTMSNVGFSPNVPQSQLGGITA